MRQLLLVHADEKLGHELARQLAEDVASATIASTIHDALTHLRERAFDALLLTPQLPDGTPCWQLVRMVRSGRYGPATLPIGLLSASTPEMSETLAQAYDANVTVIQTPINHDTIHGVLNTLCAAKRPKMLVVEDDPAAATLAREILSEAYDVELAYDGESALVSWHDRRHEIVVLDLRLPAMSGAEVLDALLVSDPSLPVIMMTAHASDTLHESLMRAGAWDFLPKPCDLFRLLALCRSALRHRASHQHGHTAPHEQRLAYRLQAAQEALGADDIDKAKLHLASARNECSVTSGYAALSDDQLLALGLTRAGLTHIGQTS